MRRRALERAGLKDLQFRDIRKAAINEAKRQGMNAQEFAGHADPRTTAKHYLNGPVRVRPTR
jgi:integrase